MNLITKTLTVGLLVVAGAAGIAIAKEGVKDPVVKARMDLMDTNIAQIKILMPMAQGKAPFDAAAAAAAKAQLQKDVSEYEARFKAPATDPVSAALPAIWTSWDDFMTKTKALGTAVDALDTKSVDGLKAGMGAIGEACSACHKVYRAPS